MTLRRASRESEQATGAFTFYYYTEYIAPKQAALPSSQGSVGLSQYSIQEKRSSCTVSPIYCPCIPMGKGGKCKSGEGVGTVSLSIIGRLARYMLASRQLATYRPTELDVTGLELLLP